MIEQKIASLEERTYYLKVVREMGWSRNVLLNQIKAGAYQRQLGPKQHNFPQTLPEHLAEQVDEAMKDVIVHAPPLYIQEKVHPTVLIDDLKKQIEESEKKDADSEQVDLFSNFNGLHSQEAKTEFYQHDSNWSNRMILGDSLQVMASLV